MSIFLDEVKPLKHYSGNFYYPIDMENRMKNSIIYLLTPNIDSSIKVMNHKFTDLNKNLFKSYFVEKNIQFIINRTNEGSGIELNGESINNTGIYSLLSENLSLFHTNTELNEEKFINNLSDTNYSIFFPDFVDEVLTEDTMNTKYGKYNLSNEFRKLLYNQRMKNQKDILILYNEIKSKVPYIKFTYVDPSLYQMKNVFYDWSFYTESYFKNNRYISNKGLDLFFGFIDRFVSDKRFGNYNKRTLVIPVDDWVKVSNTKDILDFRTSINPISMIYRSMKYVPEMFNNWKDILLVFITNNSFFTMELDPDGYKGNIPKFINLIKQMELNDSNNVENIVGDSKKAILQQLADNISKSGIQLDNLSGGTSELSKEELEEKDLLNNAKTTDDIEIKKAALVNKLNKIADQSISTKDALEKLNSKDSGSEKDMEDLKDILIDIESEEGVNMNAARSNRYLKMQKEILTKEVSGRTVKELLDSFKENSSLEEESIPIDSIDDSWKHIKFQNFNKQYTNYMDADITYVFMHFNTVTHPLNVLDIKNEDTSTSEDYKTTWTCKYEDAESGKRFNIVVDIPNLIGNRFMKLRGNEKILQGQWMLLPISKTDEDTVQMVSNYNKIFVRRKSPNGLSKSSAIVNRLTKALSKYDGKEMKVSFGSNKKVCEKYELPIEFIDLASIFSKIEFKNGSYISFNLDELRDIEFDRNLLPDEDKKLPLKELNKKYIGIYVKKVNNNKLRFPENGDWSIAASILSTINMMAKDFNDYYKVTSASKRLMYSEASILNTTIPVIVVLSYAIGLQRVLDRLKIIYHVSEKRPTIYSDDYVFKFSDAYLSIDLGEQLGHENNNLISRMGLQLLLNGLSSCDIQSHSIKEINSKDMWLDILDDFGGRIKADGLDNFYDLMFDPITKDVCHILKIPDNYIDGLIYANNLLIDNKYISHNDIRGNRLRINEIIVGHLYLVLSKEFGSYRNMVKRNKGQSIFEVKRSAVIDSILNHDQTSSDLSSLTPLLEAEMAAQTTWKGLSGMNSDRAFSADKRLYDKSMLGVVGMSTGFAGTVGINRHMTIDAGVINKRGFISSKKPKDLSTTNAFTIMEAVSPYAINHNDPFRTAMAFTQTAKHQMLVQKSMPNLVTTGADEALPYITSNKFSYKFKGKHGVVKELTDEYMIIEDQNGNKEFVDLRETIRKNSDGGFYVTTKLDPVFKKGDKLKYNDIVAYDKKSYSNAIGHQGDPQKLSYNIGTLAKVAIMNTDMGYEDSCVVDDSISEALTTEFCVQKEINLPKTANIYNIVKIGQEIQEGDPLLIFQETFEDDEDANELMLSLSSDNDELSDLARKQVRAKISGVIQDIKVFRTCELEQLSPTLLKFVKDYESRINKLKKVMKKNNINKEYELEPTYKLAQEGKLKSVDGIRIEFYIKERDKFGIGDKLVFDQALKGVNSFIIPKGKEGYTDYRKNEHVNAFLTISGVMGRMVASTQLLGFSNKLLIELTRQCQEELGIEWRALQDILKS